MKRKYNIGDRYTPKTGESYEIIDTKGIRFKIRFDSNGWETWIGSESIRKEVAYNFGYVTPIEVGRIYPSTFCGDFKITNIIDKKYCNISFVNTGYETRATYANIRKGQIKDPFHKTIYGVGFIGGDMKSSISYRLWRGMLDRCYNEASRQYTTYGGAGAVVEKGWHNYQVFHEWFVDNYIEGYHLDKDLKVPGNKVYGPQYCMFIPHGLNSTLPALKKAHILSSVKKGKYLLAFNKENKVRVYNNSTYYLIIKWGELVREHLLELYPDENLREHIIFWCEWRKNYVLDNIEKLYDKKMIAI